MRTAPVLLLAAVVSTGCFGLHQVLGFKNQAEQARLVGRIDGHVDTEGPADGPLIVVLAAPGSAEGDPLVGIDTYVRVKPGSFAFHVRAGRYLLGAYEDRNHNGLLDPGERAIRNRTNRILEVGPGQEVTQDLVIQKGAVIPELTESLDLFDLVARTPDEQRQFSLWSWSVQGKVCTDLDSDIYGAKSGQRGLWRIMDFLNDELAGIYFLEAYDSERIPVLFVHGISGHPQEFSQLMAGIDRSRFQPWFYFYPSGFGMDSLASHLAVLLERLYVEHGFDELAFVTHSMGGLVSRGALFRFQEETGRNAVRLFISLSAPWGGDERGNVAEAAPIEVPQSFKDISPASDYVRRLFYRDEEATMRRTLPAGVDYHLLFSFRMKASAKFSNDGAISVMSQLRPEAQSEAVTLRGYDLSHADILHAPEVLERVNALLDQRFR